MRAFYDFGGYAQPAQQTEKKVGYLLTKHHVNGMDFPVKVYLKIEDAQKAQEELEKQKEVRYAYIGEIEIV